MKSTGITRKVDDLGRVVLPIELRRNLGIGIGDTLEIFTDKEMIVLRRYNAVDDLLTMAVRLKDRVVVEDCGEMKPVLLDKLSEVEKLLMSEVDKY
ncbi:AbrB/MazE/SpoVT family DNA-binding domain-containing protein [Anaerotignum propionicum]|uniref:Antidote-toxin recognition MazE, antitoxin n=1 Tax=Anaerotignum propionicum DSM 1682 TaxID=991789 RepID=A0A0X1U7P3_ANAPI|nr:AbrB/MazE/SpoVT family DNA-binding domain-containing protein [Anaerotignum propionicum]AMJ40966.1 transition state regulatory protein AbrB [Anaerotignum propionicum DSM 1682]SHE59976.1 Antidote-toxin recognition MazE, antitoxin [[Clostridium] propionicum DSM 1682] [Anaerotignum propionicum DSM 1682]